MTWSALNGGKLIYSLIKVRPGLSLWALIGHITWWWNVPSTCQSSNSSKTKFATLADENQSVTTKTTASDWQSGGYQNVNSLLNPGLKHFFVLFYFTRQHALSVSTFNRTTTHFNSSHVTGCLLFCLFCMLTFFTCIASVSTLCCFFVWNVLYK